MSFALATGNTNPQGLADPPAAGSERITAPITMGSGEDSSTGFSRGVERRSDNDCVAGLARRASLVQFESHRSRVTQCRRVHESLGERHGVSSVGRACGGHDIGQHSSTSPSANDIDGQLLTADLESTIASFADDLVASSPSPRRT